MFLGMQLSHFATFLVTLQPGQTFIFGVLCHGDALVAAPLLPTFGSRHSCGPSAYPGDLGAPCARTLALELVRPPCAASRLWRSMRRARCEAEYGSTP